MWIPGWTHAPISIFIYLLLYRTNNSFASSWYIYGSILQSMSTAQVYSRRPRSRVHFFRPRYFFVERRGSALSCTANTERDMEVGFVRWILLWCLLEFYTCAYIYIYIYAYSYSRTMSSLWSNLNLSVRNVYDTYGVQERNNQGDERGYRY